MLSSILEHINLVRQYLYIFVRDLELRASLHDLSKTREPEISGFTRMSKRLSELKYGSEEYETARQELGDTLKHHYENNRHHPEHFTDGINGMNLLDIVEMFCDWKAASMKTKGGSFSESLEINRVRFKIEPQLFEIMKNTQKILGW